MAKRLGTIAAFLCAVRPTPHRRRRIQGSTKHGLSQLLANQRGAMGATEIIVWLGAAVLALVTVFGGFVDQLAAGPVTKLKTAIACIVNNEAGCAASGTRQGQGATVTMSAQTAAQNGTGPSGGRHPTVPSPIALADNGAGSPAPTAPGPITHRKAQKAEPAAAQTADATSPATASTVARSPNVPRADAGASPWSAHGEAASSFIHRFGEVFTVENTAEVMCTVGLGLFGLVADPCDHVARAALKRNDFEAAEAARADSVMNTVGIVPGAGGAAKLARSPWLRS